MREQGVQRLHEKGRKDGPWGDSQSQGQKGWMRKTCDAKGERGIPVGLKECIGWQRRRSSDPRPLTQPKGGELGTASLLRSDCNNGRGS